MKHLLLLLTAIVSTSITVYSQEHEISGNFEIRNGDTLEYRLPDEVKYLLPKFSDAAVLNHDGSRSFGKINIMILDHTLRMIDRHGDTLNVINPESISRISTEDMQIIHIDDKYMEILATYQDITLSAGHYLSINYRKGSNGSNANSSFLERFGSSVSFFSTNNYGGIGNNVFSSGPGNLSQDRTYTGEYTRRTQYVLTAGNRIFPANEKSFIKIFPKKKKAIKEFLSYFQTDFSNPEFLLTLFEFCTGQQ